MPSLQAHKTAFWVALLPGLALFAAGCAPFGARETLLYRSNFAAYQLYEEDYPDAALAEELGPTSPLQALDAGALRAMLGALEFRRQLTWTVAEGKVFSERELEYLLPYLAESITALPAGSRLLFTSRYDPDRSVLSREYRTTGLLWRDSSGINLLFGEIHETIAPTEALRNYDWTDISPVSFYRAYPDLELKSSERFAFKQVRGRPHRTWAVFAIDAAASAETPAAPVSSDAANPSEAPTEAEASPTEEQGVAPGRAETPPVEGESFIEPAPARPSATERLRELNRALEDGLVSPGEYEVQRRRILSEY